MHDEMNESGLPASEEIRLLREALVRYGDRHRMATASSMELQQVIDRAFEHVQVPTLSIFAEYEADRNSKEANRTSPSWLEPYRTMDASGDEHSAGRVGWEWLNEVAEEERKVDPGALSIETPPREGNENLAVLYRGSRMIALAFVMRDPMNFAVLLRWRDGNPIGDRN